MARESLLDSLAAGRILVCDGAVGTELQRRGLPTGLCGDVWNIENPVAVAEVHREYGEAGADLLLTNTFSSNRYRLSHFGLGHKVREVANAAVTILRSAAKPHQYLFGELGPLGEFLEPFGDISRAEAIAAFEEAARVFRELGVDGIIIETIAALDEMESAVTAVRNVAPDIPLAACFTFEKSPVGLRTMTGATPSDCAQLLAELPVDIVGTNCGTNLDKQSYTEIVQTLAEITRRPVLVEPNAGTPVLEGSRIIYKATPEELSGWVNDLIKAGARIIGGCCGTTPAHIRAIRQAVDLAVKST